MILLYTLVLFLLGLIMWLVSLRARALERSGALDRGNPRIVGG